jgi:hypothetical protein
VLGLCVGFERLVTIDTRAGGSVRRREHEIGRSCRESARRFQEVPAPWERGRLGGCDRDRVWAGRQSPRRGPADPDNRVDLRAARFGTLSFTINSSHFFYGDFINSLIRLMSLALHSHLEIMPRLSEEILFPTPHGNYMRRSSWSSALALNTRISPNAWPRVLRAQRPRTHQTTADSAWTSKRPHGSPATATAATSSAAPTPSSHNNRPTPAHRAPWTPTDSTSRAPKIKPS